MMLKSKFWFPAGRYSVLGIRRRLSQTEPTVRTRITTIRRRVEMLIHATVPEIQPVKRSPNRSSPNKWWYQRSPVTENQVRQTREPRSWNQQAEHDRAPRPMAMSPKDVRLFLHKTTV